MVDETLGVVKLLTLSRGNPPVAAVYHFTIPALGVALNKTVPVPHRLPPLEAVMVGTLSTVAVTAVREAVVQLFDVAST